MHSFHLVDAGEIFNLTLLSLPADGVTLMLLRLMHAVLHISCWLLTKKHGPVKIILQGAFLEMIFSHCHMLCVGFLVLFSWGRYQGTSNASEERRKRRNQ